MITNTTEIQGDAVTVGLYPLRNRLRVAIQHRDNIVTLEPEHIFAAARALAEVGITDPATATPPASFATSA
jgi:hypothetical protein